MSNWNKLDIEKANELTGHKVRIFVMGTAYEKLAQPKMEMKTTDTGITVPTMTHYREHDTPQYAVNYNGLYMNENQFQALAQALISQLREDFKKRGIISG
jgi:anaerobic glycerol-3-phosphate dehydrogenase